MPSLPYAPDALKPVISSATIDYHYGKHLQTYVDNLNKLTADGEYANSTLEEVVKTAPDGPVFNNAGQVLNHQLYFDQFLPTVELGDENVPTGVIAETIDRDFGTFAIFQKEMAAAAASLFGSGWVWLAMDDKGALKIIKCYNGDNPLRNGLIPLLGIDVWEHAYYLDYKNRRADHVAALWKIINWGKVNQRMQSPQ